MNTFRYDKEQRQAWVLDKLNGAKSVKRICREAGISRATLYNWIEEFPRQKDAAIKAKAEEETVDIKLIAAPELSLKQSVSGRYEMLLKALTQIDATGAVKKKLVQVLVKRFTLTVAAACELVGLEEDAYGYRPRKPEEDDRIVYDEITRLLEEDKTRTFEQCCKLLQSAHPGWPRKQIKRLWGEKKLYLQRARTRRRAVAVINQPDLQRIQRPGASWRVAHTVMPDAAWVLSIIDDTDGAPLNAVAGHGTPGTEDVIRLLMNASTENGAPRKIILAGKEPFSNREITVWIWEQKIALQTLSLGKPENEAAFTALEQKVQSELLEHGFGSGDRGAALDQWLSSSVAIA